MSAPLYNHSFMKRLLLCNGKIALKSLFIILFAFTVPLQLRATTFYSIANGAWAGTTNWSHTSGGTSCSCSPTCADTVYISHYITMSYDLINQGSNHNGITGKLTINAGGTLDGGSTYNLDIRSQGTLVDCGTVIVKNLTFDNGSYVTVCAGGILTVNGNFDNQNNSNNVFINGQMTVYGSFLNNGGGVITVTSPGNISVPNGPFNNFSTITCNGTTTTCSSIPCSISCFALPIELTLFDASAADEKVKVIWETASEVNNDHFTIEKSKDGLNYSLVAIVKGAGNTNEPLQYSVNDDQPFPGTSYYRLQQTDYDGHSRTYNPVAVRVKTMLIYPNPVTSNLNFFLYSDDHNASIELYDAEGKEIFSKQESLKNGVNSFSYDLSYLSQGLYILRVETSEGIVFDRFVK